jgi:hypothetical protein
MPTVTLAPSTENSSRASPGLSPAFSCSTPSETTVPAGQVDAAETGASASVTPATLGISATLVRSTGLTATVTVW